MNNVQRIPEITVHSVLTKGVKDFFAEGLTGSITAGSPFSPFWPKTPSAPATCSYKASREVAFFTHHVHRPIRYEGI